MTNMGMASITRWAIPAMVKGTHHDLLAKGEPLYPVSNSGDHTRHLMANNPVVTNTRIHVAVIDMHVCAANTTKSDTHRNFA